MSRVALVVLLALVAVCTAQIITPSICDKYAAIKNITDASLIKATVLGVVSSVTTDLTTKRYFDGSLAPYQWPGATDYTNPNNTVQLAHLENNLNTFFYAALKCADGTLGNYTGRNMTAAHAAMPIGPVQFESFNRQVLAVLNANGVTSIDQLSVLAVLNSLKPQICNQPACNSVPLPTTICDRYSTAKNSTEYDLMDYVVAAVIANVTTVGSPLKKYFDGSIPGTTDFTSPANAGALAALRAHLDQFFGQPSVLGCSAANFPAYGGRTLIASHAQLQINDGAFNLFNIVLLNIMTNAGVTTADTNTVNGILQTTRSQIVTQNTTSTTTTTGATGPSTTSGAATLFASSFAVFLVLFYLF